MNVYVSTAYEFICEIEKANLTAEQTNIKIADGRYEIGSAIKIFGKNIKLIGTENVILTGSVKIDVQSGEAEQNGIYKYNLKDKIKSDIKPIGGGPYEDYWGEYETMKPYLEDSVMGINLFHENKSMPVSRYPKNGFLQIKKVCGETVVREPYGKIDGCIEGKFIPEDKIVYDWINEKNAVLIGYWRYDWAMQRQRIESIENEVIKLYEPYHCFGYADRGHFYGINLRSALTEEGEWYFDHENGTLYVIPKKDQKEFTVAVSDRIFELDSCENIEFENITFEETQKAPIYMKNCNGVKICGGIVRNSGSWAIIGEKCNNTYIGGMKVYSTGGGGICLDDGGDRNTLTPSGNLIENNDISDTGIWHRVYTPGIRISGCGTVVRGNKVHDVPALGMLLHGNNHIFEKNDICNACYESNDCGGIYCGKDWSCRGNVIRYNYFHDMPGYNNNGCIGLYFDDAFSSAEVYGNIFKDCGGILVGGGRDFEIYSNTFINSGGVCVDDRLDNWGKHSIETLKKYLAAVDYKNEIWQKAYPELTDILDKKIEFPEGVKIHDNVSVGGDVVGLGGKSEKYVECENNISIV